MKYFWCLIFFTCSFFYVTAQYRVVFKLKKFPEKYKTGSVYLAGSFNNWNPKDSTYLFVLNSENIFVLTVELPAGDYEYKCTRGDWKKVECLPGGKDINNHRFEITRDTVIEINIKAWKDEFAAIINKHTAAKHVQVLDTAFYMPQLNRYRRIWIYLPESYAKTKKHYPVMYMHDGQNIFDAYTAGFGEWGVDECLDTLIRSGKPACIVVGIDNGPQRFNEYNPYEFEHYGKGEGDQYLEFLVKTLKPFIDKQYRTLPSKANTIIAGSSMGGLISYYAMLQYADVFGKAGIFSPAFWMAPYIKTVTGTLSGKLDSKFFFYMGGLEGGTYVKDMEEVQEILGEKSDAMIYSVIDPQSSHNEQAWRKWFAEFYTWIMAEGFNNVVKPAK